MQKKRAHGHSPGQVFENDSENLSNHLPKTVQFDKTLDVNAASDPHVEVF